METRLRRKTPGRRPLSEGNAEETRKEILRHAANLFNERGYAAVSIEDILAAADLTRGTLYYHFKGKSDIFVAAMLAMAAAIRHVVETIVTRRDLSAEQRIRLLVRTKRESTTLVSEENPDAVHLSEKMVEEAMMHLSPPQQAQIGMALGEIHALVQRLLAEGIERGELRPLPPETMDFALWQLLFQPNSHSENRSDNQAEWDDGLLDLFFKGVRAL